MIEITSGRSGALQCLAHLCGSLRIDLAGALAGHQEVIQKLASCEGVCRLHGLVAQDHQGDSRFMCKHKSIINVYNVYSLWLSPRTCGILTIIFTTPFDDFLMHYSCLLGSFGSGSQILAVGQDFRKVLQRQLNKGKVPEDIAACLKQAV